MPYPEILEGSRQILSTPPPPFAICFGVGNIVGGGDEARLHNLGGDREHLFHSHSQLVVFFGL